MDEPTTIHPEASELATLLREQWPVMQRELRATGVPLCDEDEGAAEATEDVRSEAAETAEESPESPPWGDDFDPSRAWNTIQTLRDEVKGLKKGSQDPRERELLDAFRDPNRHAEIAEALGWELADDDEEFDQEDDDGDPYERKLSELDERVRQRELDQDLRDFNSHLDDLAKESDLKLSQRDRKVLLDASVEYGFNPVATQKAFEEFVEERKAYDKAVIDGYVKGKKGVPGVPKVGSSATEVPNLDDRSERVRWMTERLQQAQ